MSSLTLCFMQHVDSATVEVITRLTFNHQQNQVFAKLGRDFPPLPLNESCTNCLFDVRAVKATFERLEKLGSFFCEKEPGNRPRRLKAQAVPKRDPSKIVISHRQATLLLGHDETALPDLIRDGFVQVAKGGINGKPAFYHHGINEITE